MAAGHLRAKVFRFLVQRAVVLRCLDWGDRPHVRELHSHGAGLMGARGPAPMPIALRRLHGETRPSRLNEREPRPRGGLPPMPHDMDQDAQAEWRRVARTMGKTGVITVADAMILRLYCEASSRYRQAAHLYTQTGPVLNRRGEIVKSPLHQLVREHADQVRQFARELGLTPAARVGLTGYPEPERDEFGLFLDGVD